MGRILDAAGEILAVDGSDRLRARFTSAGLETLWRGDPEARLYPKGAPAARRGS